MLDVVQHSLLDALERRKLLVCVGPGISAAAGLPGPAGLVERCRQALAATGRDADGVAAERGVARALEHAEASLGSAAFVRLVQAAWEPRVPVPVPEVARALVGLAPGLNAIVTTNLDRLLERAFEGRWHVIDEAAPDIARRTQAIFKVRGTIDRPTGWVVTARQQENASFFGVMLRGELAALLRSHVVLWIGFDPDDEELARLLAIRGHAVADERHRSTETTRPDVMLVPTTAWTERARAWLGARGVDLVALPGDDSTALSGLLRALAEELGRRADRPAPANAAELESAEPSASNPYPGLEPFTADDRRYYFGREDDVTRALGRLRGATPLRQWLLVDGPSGVGKSSFLQAGLVPTMRDGGAAIACVDHHWRVVMMRPGAAPVFGLAEQVHRALVHEPAPRSSASALAAEVLHRTGALAEFVAVHLAADEGLLLIVDQLEEALVAPSSEQRESFAAALAEMLLRSPRPLLLITGLRSDFSGDMPRLPALHERMTGPRPPLRYTLAPLSATQLAAAIEGPAREARVELEAGLTRRLLADAGQIEHGGGPSVDRTPESVLPLVAAVMASLYVQRSGRTLTHAAYDALGGVAGALTRRADEAIAPLLREFSDDRLWSVFRGLVDAESHGRASRRTLARAEVLAAAGGGAGAEAMLTRLAGGGGAMRLVVVRGDGADARVDLVHESLLRGWSWLREHIDRDRVELIREAEVIAAAERWHRRGRSRDALPGPAEMEEFIRARTTAGTLARTYQDALSAFRRRQRRLSRVLRICALVVVVGLAHYGLILRPITRSFAIGLHVIPDPNRVLLTKLPETVTVEVHGPRNRVILLTPHLVGPAELDLADARPGPLSIDPETLNVPEGVTVSRLRHEEIDLRFDRVIERAVLIQPELRGAVHPDFEHIGTTVDPVRWRIRGGSGVVGEIDRLVTAPIDLSGIRTDSSVVVALVRPRVAVEFAAVVPGEVPRVTVTVRVRPRAVSGG